MTPSGTPTGTKGSATVTLIARFAALPGHHDEAARLLDGYAQRVRREPGCLQFLAFTDQSAPDQFIVFEQYLDAQAFEDHIGSEHNSLFNVSLTQHAQAPSILQFLTAT